MPALQLSSADRDMLQGRSGEAAQLAMRIVVAMAEAVRAERLIDVVSAHIDGCLFHGQASLDFAERLAGAGARVRIPATLNVGLVDLLHPELANADGGTAEKGRRLMDLYAAMGCRPTFTCAPYQLPDRPGRGEHVAWAESNAIVFANSVLGARTDRYGDFIDISAAITGRAPDAGLHRTGNRRGQVLFALQSIPRRLLDDDVFYPVLGHLIGAESGTLVPVIEGLPAGTSEDRLRALGAAAASSGSVALFHAVGLTPEAPTRDAAFQGRPPMRTVEVGTDALGTARDSLSTATTERLAAVSLGTPHFSRTEFARLTRLVEDFTKHAEVDFYVSTSRDILEEVRGRGWLARYEQAGITVVVDTCTYLTPLVGPRKGPVMTNSAKWAFYAPGNIGVDVVFGSLEECVRSAAEGRVWRDEGLWAGC